MTQKQLVTRIQSEAARVAERVPRAVWYLFGSALRDVVLAADIDVLVLCETDEEVVSVRAELKSLCQALPMHLFLLTRAEDAELGFVSGQGCVQIYPDVGEI